MKTLLLGVQFTCTVTHEGVPMSMEVDAVDTGVLLIISLVTLLSLGCDGGRLLRRGC